MQDDSAEFLNRLYRDYHYQLRRWVMGQVERKDIAEEIVQETFLTLCRNYQNQEVRFPWALLTRIAQRKIIDYLRRSKHEKSTVLPEADEIPEECRPDRLAEDEEMAKRLIAAIESLPSALREVMIMRFSDHLSPREVAEKLQITLSAVEQRMTRALECCRLMLSTAQPDGRAPY